MKMRVAFSFLVLALALSGPNLQAVAEPSAPVAEWIDDFDSPTLDSRWLWVNEDPSHWSLTERPGFMRITAQDGGQNLLLQNAPTDDYAVETRLLFEPTQNIQRAGLLLFQDFDNSFSLMRAFCGFPPGCVDNGIYFDHVEAGQPVGSNFAMTTSVTGEAYLRVERLGNAYTGYVSEDGEHWTLVGTHVAGVGFAPSMIGLFANYSSLGAGEIPADFDSFTLREDSERVYLPFISR
jgi:beta-xylosidase